MEPNVAKENAKAGELNEKNPVATTEQKTITSIKNEEKTMIEAVGENVVVEVPVVSASGGENKVQERPASENVQKEWTCAVCQVTTTCVEKLKSHLHGREYKSQWAELKAIMATNKNKGCSSSTANQEPQKPIFGNWINQNKSKKQEDKAQVNRTSEQCK